MEYFFKKKTEGAMINMMEMKEIKKGIEMHLAHDMSFHGDPIPFSLYRLGRILRIKRLMLKAMRMNVKALERQSKYYKLQYKSFADELEKLVKESKKEN